ncbi:hypothetical protein [Saccharolobus caldissimus]|uniref:Uncharacterized protein n=1 Tax=Saccharolobus caldissimus TaxID=1702097 RepID=A0AAQ4CRC1_9CREN|nr:hypothetical protein [Saccharolobus caldissimus]BDB98352.1 hypothetical protein SACC_13690 [Saccharolobus caldissimus]
MELIVYNMVVDGEIKVKNVQKFFENLTNAVNIISQTYNTEPFKSLSEKYRDEIKGLDEVKDKDSVVYISYLAHRIFDDYFNNGKLRGLFDEVSTVIRNKKQKEKMIKEIVSEEESAEEESLILPIIWTFKTSEPLLDIIKKLDKNSDKEFELEYLGLKVYLTIKPSPDEIGYYEPYIFFTSNKPRLGIKLGEISVDPYEIRMTQLNENRANFILPIIEKICGKLTLKSKTQMKIHNPFEFSNTSYLITALRYTNWALKTSRLSLSEIINFLPFILENLDRPKAFIKAILDAYNKMEKDGVDLDSISNEVKNLGWYNIILPSKPNKVNNRSISKVKKFFDIGMKLGDPIILFTYLFMSVITVYKINGYEYKELFKILV